MFIWPLSLIKIINLPNDAFIFKNYPQPLIINNAIKKWELSILRANLQ
jgi:hypothetical protein